MDWKPGDRWGPLCDATGVDLPDEPFRHLNTREDFPRLNEDTNVVEA